MVIVHIHGYGSRISIIMRPYDRLSVNAQIYNSIISGCHALILSRIHVDGLTAVHACGFENPRSIIENFLAAFRA